MPTIDKTDKNYIFYYVGKQIKKYRQLKGWSQSKLAKEANFTDTFISNLENNAFQGISLPNLFHISQLLEIPIMNLFEGLEEDIKSK